MSDHLKIPFDLALLATTRYTALDGPSLAGLLRLYAAAWEDGNRLPADDMTLAAVSGLGGDWHDSALRRWLARFFKSPIGEPDTLVAYDLSDKLAKRQAISAARRAAGIASGAARRSKIEHATGNLEQMFDRDLTDVMPLTDDDAPAPAKRGRKAKEAKALAPPARSVKREVPSAAAAPIAAAAPPATPVLGFSSVCVDTNHTQPKTIEECAGRGGQLTFWAAEEPLPPVSLVPAPGAAEAIVALYATKVDPLYPPDDATLAAVRHWITAGGHTQAQLEDAVTSYARAVAEKPQRYRKSPANFFSVSEAFFRGWVGKARPCASAEEAARAREQRAREMAAARETERAASGDVASKWKEARERMKS